MSRGKMKLFHIFLLQAQILRGNFIDIKKPQASTLCEAVTIFIHEHCHDDENFIALLTAFDMTNRPHLICEEGDIFFVSALEPTLKR